MEDLLGLPQLAQGVWEEDEEDKDLSLAYHRAYFTLPRWSSYRENPCTGGLGDVPTEQDLCPEPYGPEVGVPFLNHTEATGKSRELQLTAPSHRKVLLGWSLGKRLHFPPASHKSTPFTECSALLRKMWQSQVIPREVLGALSSIYSSGSQCGWGWGCPSGDIQQRLRHFGLSQSGRREKSIATSMRQVEARDAAKHCPVHRTAPQ